MTAPPPFDAPWFCALVGAVVGAALGSFSTMLAYRLPRRLSIIRPDSFCPSCNAPLGARDLVPLLSFLWNAGKCRFCRAPIGRRYFFIELASTVLCALAALCLGPQVSFLAALPLIVFAVTLAAIFLTRR